MRPSRSSSSLWRMSWKPEGRDTWMRTEEKNVDRYYFTSLKGSLWIGLCLSGRTLLHSWKLSYERRRVEKEKLLNCFWAGRIGWRWWQAPNLGRHISTGVVHVSVFPRKRGSLQRFRTRENINYNRRSGMRKI